ncbi:2-amino-4-hydroxy-6-hydroxymethyldihydropteridine diphosphokinase [Microbacterium stercoris]|uniref:2-amino-4-hydroxy-6-hydroxymethyldihydropteridine diphosphokinase n=1 Tax=Microbacterium stercoris TaxID=2820289 RepID=A0A939QHB1_9MICO|nr:2-amino-4-hydroxy-6-hydroxymethyldihydropteridine diphosphokinase [Microbacterium stercoris]
MSKDLTRPLGTPPAREPRETVTAVVALGANLGERAETLDEAVAELRRLPLVDEVVASDAIESVALTLDGPDETAPRYLNGVALVRTRLAPSVLLGMLHAIEARHGRERRERWGARTLDLDLIAYGDVVSEDEALILPHPRAHERDFVLAPWLQVDPDAVLPGRGRVADLLAALRGSAG